MASLQQLKQSADISLLRFCLFIVRLARRSMSIVWLELLPQMTFLKFKPLLKIIQVILETTNTVRIEIGSFLFLGMDRYKQNEGDKGFLPQ